jgi:hypothetical protein
MRFEDGFLDRMAAPMQQAFDAMDALERGAIANPDENRMVGHYWLRERGLAPSLAIAAEIRNTLTKIQVFASGVHDGSTRTPGSSRATTSSRTRRVEAARRPSGRRMPTRSPSCSSRAAPPARRRRRCCATATSSPTSSAPSSSARHPRRRRRS